MSAPERSLAIDAVRGAVMVLMVLDHARDFFFGVRVDPTDLESTTPVLFFTRWVTHFCAPGFVLLAGAAAYLYGEKRSAAERRRFLFTRGLWLVVLEVTVVRFGWVPEPFYRFTLLQVIWAIGWSMVILAPLSALSPKVLVALGAAMVVTHNVLDPIEARALGDLAFPGPSCTTASSSSPPPATSWRSATRSSPGSGSWRSASAWARSSRGPPRSGSAGSSASA
ncbi:MAG: heparan-alpha-glucosaminide N-acetyltransferase domain-containing protein [Sandaracinaceae bacterium]|nr:heparan-alpha-glucosaminide N-acetyltransferase domain-containing protein [Sandaracinaceae bacterium]